MTTISLHIEYLLQRFPCVIVPGIGAFMVTHSEARIDFDKRCAYPPMRILSFNSCVNNDDSLLANSYARHMGVSFEQGHREMLQDISTLQEILHSEREVALGRLGILKLEEDGRIVFIARLSPESYMAQMGMDAVTLSKDRTTIELKDNANDEDIELTQSDLKAQDENTAKDNRYVTWRIPKTLLRLTASVIILIMGIGTLLTFNNQNFNKTENNKIEQASVLPVNVQKNVAATVVDTLKTVQNAPRQIEIDADIDAYYLIVATFHRLDEAHSFVEQYDTEEYPLVVVRSNSKNIFRVSAATSDERNQLRKIMNQDSFSKRFVQPWIWCQAN